MYSLLCQWQTTLKCMQKFSIWFQYCASSNNSDKLVSYSKFACYCTVLTKMRVWNPRLKSEFRGSIFRQPEKALGRTVDQVVATIILVDFKEKLHISVEYKSLIFCLSLHFCCPCTDFVVERPTFITRSNGWPGYVVPKNPQTLLLNDLRF